MLRGESVLGVIPARGGSKGLSRKNLRALRGRPLVEWALRCGLDAETVDHVILTSDDPEILAIGESLGVVVLPRPAEASTDSATADDVARHLLLAIPDHLRKGDPWIVYLQPTSPLRTPASVDAALALLAEKEADALVSVVEAHPSPFKALQIDTDGRLEPLYEELPHANRQDLPLTYFPNGAIYVFRLSRMVAERRFPTEGAIPFVMSARESMDVDTHFDLTVADLLMQQELGG